MFNQVEAKPGLGMTYDTSLSPAPAPESQGESVAAPAEVGQVGGTQSVLQQLRRDWLVVFLALGFVAPIFLSALRVAVLWIAVFVEANYSEYSGAIYGWSLWLFVCLFSAIWCYRAEKREKGL